MRLNKGLTKENFWDDIIEQYPVPTKMFCEWVDEYKKAVNWNAMFAANETTMQLHSSKYKFHDLPYDMQVGIWIRFADDTLNQFFEQPEYSYCGDLEEDIKTVFKEIDTSEDE